MSEDNGIPSFNVDPLVYSIKHASSAALSWLDHEGDGLIQGNTKEEAVYFAVKWLYTSTQQLNEISLESLNDDPKVKITSKHSVVSTDIATGIERFYSTIEEKLNQITVSSADLLPNKSEINIILSGNYRRIDLPTNMEDNEGNLEENYGKLKGVVDIKIVQQQCLASNVDVKDLEKEVPPIMNFRRWYERNENRNVRTLYHFLLACSKIDRTVYKNRGTSAFKRPSPSGRFQRGSGRYSHVGL